jgi:hypothetical protein
MRSIKGVCLCLLALVALGAAVVSNAGAVEVGECVKQSKNELTKKFEGEYTDKSCQLKSPTHEGKYNWQPGVKPENTAFTANSKKIQFQSALGTYGCFQSFVVGKWTGPKTAEEVITYRGCDEEMECRSGVEPGTVQTEKLQVTLLGEGEQSLQLNGKNELEFVEPKAGEVWEQLRGPGGELESTMAELECEAGSVEVRRKGNLAGVLAPSSLNVSSKKSIVEFGEGKGAQGVSLETSTGGPFEPAGRETETTVVKSKGKKLVISTVEK